MVRTRPKHSDQGSILLMVLVITVVLSLVVVGLATYASGTLRYGQVVESSADRLAAANSAMDNALEDIRRGTSPCTSTTFTNGTSFSYGLSDPINGIRPTITCTVVGNDVTPVDAFALILTGAERNSGDQTGELLTVTGAASDIKKVHGPIYLAEPPRVSTPNQSINLSANLEIQDGNIEYSTTGTCSPPPAIDLVVGPSKKIVFNPTVGYSAVCGPGTWQSRFLPLKPTDPTINAANFPLQSSARPLPLVTANGQCYVWRPGQYNNAPDLGEYNYFASGDYYFNDINTWTMQNAFVLFGWPGGTGPSIEDNKVNSNGKPAHTVNALTNPCHDAWSSDTQIGAAVYMGGHSAINMASNASLEISGRVHDGYYIGLQALDASSVRSTISGDERILSTDAGNQKQLSVQGLVWAPYAGFEFSNIANDSVEALTGGAALSELELGAAAGTNGLAITVQSQPSVTTYYITAAATNSGTTTVRSHIQYRVEGQAKLVAVISRRVVGLTPE